MSNELQQIEGEVKHSQELANIVIKSQLDYEKASAITKNLRELKKKVLATFDPIVEKTRAAWKESIAQKDKYLNPIESAIEIVDGKIRGYLTEKERERKEAELKLQQEAEAMARKEKEKLEARAEKAEASGKVEKAEALKEQAEQVEAIVPVVMPTVQKVEGQSLRTTWKAKVTNFKLLPDEYKISNQQLLDSVARSSKGAMVIPGVEMYEVKTLSQR
jgi:exonuclease VII large subunit